MSTGSYPSVPGSLVTTPERLQLALLAGRDQDLRRHIQQAGIRAPDVRRQIRQMAQVRAVGVRGLRGGQLHLVAMPVLLNFGRTVICPAEVRLSTSGTELESRLHAWWRYVMAGNVLDLRVLPHAVHLEAVLGISPTAVHEFAFFGASLVEGARVQLPSLRLHDRGLREAGAGSLVPYLLMALVTCVGDLVVDETTWRRGQLGAETLLAAVFATLQARPRASLLTPAGFFDAVDAAQAAQLVDAVDWVKRQGGKHHFEFGHGMHGDLVVEFVYELPKIERVGRMIWTYDGTWREPPNLALGAEGACSLSESRRVSLRGAYRVMAGRQGPH